MNVYDFRGRHGVSGATVHVPSFMTRVRSQVERSDLLPENFLLFKAFFCFASSDVSFVLYSVRKMEWAVMPTALLIFGSLFVKEFQFLPMGSPRSLSSCDEAPLWGWTGNDLSSLGLYFWHLVGADWGEVWV